MKNPRTLSQINEPWIGPFEIGPTHQKVTLIFRKGVTNEHLKIREVKPFFIDVVTLINLNIIYNKSTIVLESNSYYLHYVYAVC
jgi:hypothetical protein